MVVIIMATLTLVPPVITPGAKAGRFFVFVKQTVSLRSRLTLQKDWLLARRKLKFALLASAGESEGRRILQANRALDLIIC